MTTQAVENLCRMCAEPGQDANSLMSVFSTKLKCDSQRREQQPKRIEGFPVAPTAAHAMACCLDVEIKPNDQLPQRICHACLNKLQESWSLRETCKANQQWLKELLHTPDEPTTVKCEVELSFEDESYLMSFVDDAAPEDTEELDEEDRPSKVVDPSDPLHSEHGWLYSDLTKGYFKTKRGDAPSWEIVDVDDYRCCGCFRFFDSKAELEKHCKRDHKAEPYGDKNKRYECNVCYKLFSNTETLSFHQKLARSRQLFHCKLCHVLSPSKRQVKTHVKLHDKGEKMEVIAKQELRASRSKSTRDIPSTAPCQKTLDDIFPSSDDGSIKNFITFDYATFDGFCCCDCLTYCSSKREMKRHGEKEHQGNRGFDEEHSCFACMKSFESKKTYDLHMNELNAKHLYYCKTCQLVFRSSSDLHKHQQTSVEHEGFIELDVVDIKEEVEVEEKVSILETQSANVPESSKQRVSTVQKRSSSPIDEPEFEDCNDDDDDEDYEPDGESESQNFKEPYGRRLYSSQTKVKRNDPDLAEISVVDISTQDVVRCCGCYQTFITEEELAEHSNQHHQPSQQYDAKDHPYQCDRCYRRFVTAVSLQVHHLFVKNVQIYSCKLCKEQFNFKTQFLFHYSLHEKYSPKEERRGAKPKATSDDLKFYCCFSACKESYAECSDLLLHVDDHHGVKRNQYKDYRDSDDNCCEICFRSFNSYRGLLRHAVGQKRPVTSKHVCTTCGLQTKSAVALKDHENKHLGIKPYQCEVCNKMFGTKNILKNHMIVHQADRPFSCEICGKTFARKRNWKDHARIHQDEKPWECEICKLTFRIESQFLTHIRRHTGVRPYKCKFCDKVFSHATDRKRHEMAAHTGEKPHQCSFCSLAFIRKRQLVIHERTHTGEKPFECHQCGQAFIQQSYLTRHLATHKQRDATVGGEY